MPRWSVSALPSTVLVRQPTVVRVTIAGCRAENLPRRRMGKASYALYLSGPRRGQRGCVELRQWTASTLRSVRDRSSHLGYAPFIHDHIVRDEPAVGGAVNDLE